MGNHHTGEISLLRGNVDVRLKLNGILQKWFVRSWAGRAKYPVDAIQLLDRGGKKWLAINSLLRFLSVLDQLFVMGVLIAYICSI
jgi:hypothetical protein